MKPALFSRSRLGAALGGLLLASAALTASAQDVAPPPPPAPAGQPGPGPAPRGGEHRFGRQLLQALNLTDAQKTQLRTIAQKTFDDLKPLHQQVRELGGQLQAELTKPQLDERRIGDLQTRQLALGDQIARRMSDARVQSAAVLTPEQRTALDKQFADLRARFDKERPGNEGDARGPRPGEHPANGDKNKGPKAGDRGPQRGGDLRDLGLLLPMMPPMR